MVAATWQDTAIANVDDRLLALARELAQRNLVENQLVTVYRSRFPFSKHQELEEMRHLFWSNLTEATELLTSAGISALFIKSGLEAANPASSTKTSNLMTSACEYSDFDLVIGAEGWNRAVAALMPWAVSVTSSRLEPGKLMLQPARGPAAHLHRTVSWFGIPVIPISALRAKARPMPGLSGLLLPSTADALRIWVAHAVFQNLAFDLSELLQLRRLANADSVAQARQAAELEGWGRAFTKAFNTATAGMARLDYGEATRLPLLLPILPSLTAGFEHAVHLLKHRHRWPALRELGLRPLLVAAKHRRTLNG